MRLVQDDGRVVESEGKKASGALFEARQGLAIAVRIPPPNEQARSLRFLFTMSNSTRTRFTQDPHSTLASELTRFMERYRHNNITQGP